MIVNLEKEKNKTLATRYLSENFSENPDQFFTFLELLEQYLSLNKKSDLSSKIAPKYLKILSPLCEKFSFYDEKNKLNDLSFEMTSPIKYKQIQQILEKYKKNSTNILKNILENLDSILQENKCFTYKISGRYKNIFSIYKKIKKNADQSILNLNDIFAFRIILENNNPKNCFKVLNQLHDAFVPIPSSFKDYINIPKINGYQSLHTGLNQVFEDLDLPIEVQIRTEEMHKYAEKGQAAHWLYAREKKSKLPDKKDIKLSQHLTRNKNPYIFCFSPTGDIFELKEGASLKDFAYKIHTEVGKKAIQGKINHKLCPLKTPLQNGDQVEIITENSL